PVQSLRRFWLILLTRYPLPTPHGDMVLGGDPIPPILPPLAGRGRMLVRRLGILPVDAHAHTPTNHVTTTSLSTPSPALKVPAIAIVRRMGVSGRTGRSNDPAFWAASLSASLNVTPGYSRITC